MRSKIMGFCFVGAAALIGIIGCAGDGIGQSDTDIGLRKVALDSEKVTLADISYSAADAGTSKVIERSFDNAPPLIPHSVEGMMDMTKDVNMCLDCHAPEVAASINATPVPASHLVDMRSAKKKIQKVVSEERWNCSQCHVATSDAKPLIKNNFEPIFRDEKGGFKSNLLDVLNEGTK